jgi:hypothetical protein
MGMVEQNWEYCLSSLYCTATKQFYREENIMSTLAYSPIHGADLLRGYVRNVAHVGHLFLGALIALKPAQVERRISRRQRLKAVLMLNEMAHDYEDSMPNLSAELRYLAKRG